MVQLLLVVLRQLLSVFLVPGCLFCVAIEMNVMLLMASKLTWQALDYFNQLFFGNLHVSPNINIQLLLTELNTFSYSIS